MSGFRSINVGYDNEDHERFFHKIASGSVSVHDFKEPGYSLLSLVVSYFGNYSLFLIVYSAISILILIITIRYFSVNPYVSLYMYYAFYFLGNNMGKIRQSLAVLFLLLALKYLNKNEKKIFVIIVIIGATFHASALFFLVFLFLNKINLSKKVMYFCIVLAVIIGQLGIVEYIYYNLIGKSQFISSIDFLDLKRLSLYSDSEYTVRQGGGYLGFLYILINSVLVVWFFDKFKQFKDKKALIIAKTYYWGTIFFFLFFNLALINSRLTMGFLMTQIFLVPYLFKFINNKYIKFLFAAIILIVVTLRGYINFVDNYDLFVPFEFFWE